MGHGAPGCTDVTAQGGKQCVPRMFLTSESCDQGTNGQGVSGCFAGRTRPDAFAIGRATTRAALAAEAPVRLHSPHHAPNAQLPRPTPMEDHGNGVPGCHESCRASPYDRPPGERRPPKAWPLPALSGAGRTRFLASLWTKHPAGNYGSVPSRQHGTASFPSSASRYPQGGEGR